MRNLKSNVLGFRVMRKARTTIANLLCFCISWTSVFPAYAESPMTLSELYEKYPDARVIHVSREEYPALTAVLAQNGYRTAGERAALSDEDERGSRTSTIKNAKEPGASGDCDEERQASNPGDLTLHFSDGNMPRLGGSSDEAAVLFVVIGAVVLVVWTLYAVKYLMDVAAGRRGCGAWSDLVFSSSWVSGAGVESAWFGGVRFLSGIRDGATDVGLSGEIGRSHIQLPNDFIDVRGTYWLLGPLLRWRAGGLSSNPHYFQMEFLAGSTTNDEVGLIAQAKAGVSFGAGNNFRWGLNFGALNINLSGTGGIISERSQYHSLLGLDLGYRF